MAHRIKVLEVARLLPDTSERTLFRRLKTLEVGAVAALGVLLFQLNC